MHRTCNTVLVHRSLNINFPFRISWTLSLKHLQLITWNCANCLQYVHHKRWEGGKAVYTLDYRFLDSRQCNSRADTFRFSMIRLTRYRSVIGERTKGRRWKVPRRRPRRTMAEVGEKAEGKKGRENSIGVRWDRDRCASIFFISNRTRSWWNY